MITINSSCEDNSTILSFFVCKHKSDIYICTLLAFQRVLSDDSCEPGHWYIQRTDEKNAIYLVVKVSFYIYISIYIYTSYKGENLLNKRTDTLDTCRHRNKYKLKNCDPKDWRHKSIP